MDRLINVPLCVLASFRDKNAEIRCKPILRTRNLEESSENNKGAQHFKLKDIPIDTGMKTRKYPKVEKEMDEDCDPEEDEVYEEWKPEKKKRNKDLKPAEKEMDEDCDPEEEEVYEEWKPEKKKGNKDLKPWSGVSEIERLALKNREEHLALLRSLKIEQAKEDFIQAVEELKPKMKPKPVKRVYKSKPSSPPVLRKSKRLAKMSVDLSEGALYAKAIEKAEEEAEEIIKKEIPPILPFKDALHSKGEYEDFDKDFRWASNENSTYECDLSSNADNRYVSRFPFMKIDESKVAKVVPARITAMALNPLPDRIIVTAADKYGNMGFWKVNLTTMEVIVVNSPILRVITRDFHAKKRKKNPLDSESDPYLFEVHYQNIPHLQYNPVNPNMILSCSYDGSVRCGDLENRIFSEVYVDEYSSCSYFDFLSPTSLIVGKKSGCIAVVDFRNGKSSAKSHECHEHPVKTVSIHPVNKNYFITAMNRGTVSLWDLRKLQKKPVSSITHHKKSANSAYFSPVTGNSILTTSLDDSLCLFDSSNLTESLPLKKSVRHNNFTGRWLSIFRATWLPETDDVFVVGSMEQPRRIQIFNDNMKNIYNFMDEDLSSITSINRFHPSKSVLAGGNSSGKVFVFVDSQ